MDSLMIGRHQIPSQVDPKRLPGGQSTPGTGFSTALQSAINDVANLQGAASKAVQNVQSGQTANLSDAMIALEKADISFRTMLQVRNKIIEAYQEVMRMQV